MTNSIPPDPYIAAGPDYIMATVNSVFAIWDKEGNLIQTFSANQWYSSVLSDVSAFDPKILYDHLAQRWIMVWLDQDDNAQRGSFLISVSDDEDPNGTWYNWDLPSNKNGNSASGNWGDYQGVGFDKDAIYITSNQFSFAGSFQYAKIRIIPKAQLYNNTAGQVEWSDIWDIRYPSPLQKEKIFNIRPSISYSDTSSEYYLLHAPSGGGNFMTMFKITNSIDSANLIKVNVPVSAYNSAPNADQLGGSTTLLEGAGSAIRNEPTYRDGYLWTIHSIQNPNSSKYSSVKYVKIDVSANQAVEDFAFSDDNHWYYYTALAVDKDQNVAITFSRSGEDEYASSYYTSRLKNDPPGFEPSKLLQSGKGNYVVTFSGERNRWGDYNGMWLDPVTQQNIWMFVENAAGVNAWGTWVGEIRMVPFPGSYAFNDKDKWEFGDIEVNKISDTIEVVIGNYGKDDLEITSIPDSSGPFHLIEKLIFPITLQTYDSLRLSFYFQPIDSGLFETDYKINNNSTNFTAINLKGHGYQIFPAEQNVSLCFFRVK